MPRLPPFTSFRAQPRRLLATPAGSGLPCSEAIQLAYGLGGDVRIVSPVWIVDKPFAATDVFAAPLVVRPTRQLDEATPFEACPCRVVPGCQDPRDYRTCRMGSRRPRCKRARRFRRSAERQLPLESPSFLTSTFCWMERGPTRARTPACLHAYPKTP